MAIEITPYLSQHEAAVGDFNARLAAAGADWAFYDKARPEWLPTGVSDNTWRDYFVAVEDGSAVRGAYCLRTQRFLFQGEPVEASSIQGPISEGLIDKRFGMLAFHMIRDMEQRAPRLFGWGSSERMLAVLRKLRWREFRTPFLLRLVKVNRFLRLNKFLRSSRARRMALDALAASGLGAAGARGLQWAGRIASGGAWTPRATVTECARFGPWADEIWEAARGGYAFVATRDQATMNAVVPTDGWPLAMILRVDSGGRTLGWAVARDTQFEDDARFGKLRVGASVDSLARPGEEGKVIQAATRFLQARGVDIIAAAHTHPVWLAAFAGAGFLASKGRRPFVIAPGLSGIIGSTDDVIAGVHLTLLDGDGPHGL